MKEHRLSLSNGCYLMNVFLMKPYVQQNIYTYTQSPSNLSYVCKTNRNEYRTTCALAVRLSLRRIGSADTYVCGYPHPDENKANIQSDQVIIQLQHLT